MRFILGGRCFAGGASLKNMAIIYLLSTIKYYSYVLPQFIYFFLATNEHKFSLTKGRASQIPFGLFLPRMALVPIGAICGLKKIIVSGFPKCCLWTTEGRARQLLYYCQKYNDTTSVASGDDYLRRLLF